MISCAWVARWRLTVERRILGACSFAVAGHVTGFGSRQWLSTHPPETRTAPVLMRLVDNGAVLLGKTIMAEFGYRCGARAIALRAQS